MLPDYSIGSEKVCLTCCTSLVNECAARGSARRDRHKCDRVVTLRKNKPTQNQRGSAKEPRPLLLHTSSHQDSNKSSSSLRRVIGVSSALTDHLLSRNPSGQ